MGQQWPRSNHTAGFDHRQIPPRLSTMRLWAGHSTIPPLLLSRASHSPPAPQWAKPQHGGAYHCETVNCGLWQSSREGSMTLEYHQHPRVNHIVPGASMRFTRAMTPYHFKVTGKGWSLRFGHSAFLVAEGPPASADVGRKLFRQLENDWLGRGPKRKSKKRKI